VEGESMALIKCIECGKVFSDKASSCPECACPTNASMTEQNQKSTQIILDSNNELPTDALQNESLQDLNLNNSNNYGIDDFTNLNSITTGDLSRSSATSEVTDGLNLANPDQTFTQHNQEQGIDTSTPPTAQLPSLWQICGVCFAVVFLFLVIQYFSNSSYSDFSDDIRICNNLGGSWDAWSRTCR
jgi:predicted  nucleic acid-binding Zn-ribbon protein